MTQVQLPAHLANRQVRTLTERAAEGMGSSMPPHVSIKGNAFTFIDAAGNGYKPVLTFDATIIDVSDVMCKQYYDKPYDETAQMTEPPSCWSANGIAPSREATRPMALTCVDCAMNVRGSAISKKSGSAIKACRDEKWIAILVPQMPQMVFQLKITPGSFSNWKGYTETFRNYGVEISLGLTRFSFVPRENGVMLFEHVGWVDEATIGAVEASVREKKTDAIVGRTDQPRVATLAAPAAQQQATLPPPNQFTGDGRGMVVPPQQEVMPPPASFVPAAAGSVAPTVSPQVPFPSATPSIAPVQAQPFPVGGATTASPSEQPAPRRRRRTSAEIAADQASQPAVAAQQGFVPAAVPQPTLQQAAPQVPFPVAQPGAAATGAAQFGMQPGAPVNAEMAAMLKSMGFERVAG